MFSFPTPPVSKTRAPKKTSATVVEAMRSKVRPYKLLCPKLPGAIGGESWSHWLRGGCCGWCILMLFFLLILNGSFKGNSTASSWITGLLDDVAMMIVIFWAGVKINPLNPTKMMPWWIVPAGNGNHMVNVRRWMDGSSVVSPIIIFQVPWIATAVYLSNLVFLLQLFECTSWKRAGRTCFRNFKKGHFGPFGPVYTDVVDSV